VNWTPRKLPFAKGRYRDNAGSQFSPDRMFNFENRLHRKLAGTLLISQ
jgi:hypothetical protein